MRASERATRRSGDRAGRHAGGSTVPWGWCGRACTGLARAHQRAHGGIPPAFQRRQISRSLGSTCPSHLPFCATRHNPCNSRTHHRTFQACSRPTTSHLASLPRSQSSSGMARAVVTVVVCMLFFVFFPFCSNYRLLLCDLPCYCQPTKNVGGERSRVLSDLVPPARMSPGWLTVLEGNNGM